MKLQIRPIPRPEWAPLSHQGSHGVEGKSLLRLDGLSLALLRFQPGGTIHEHATDIDIDVICLEGQGLTSLAGETAALHAGEQVRWPSGIPHRLWTDTGHMLTLMVEHIKA